MAYDVKPCQVKAAPRAKKTLKKTLPKGSVYGGRFEAGWGKDKKGFSDVVVLRDDGDAVLVAPIRQTGSKKPNRLHIPVSTKKRDISGLILLDHSCKIKKSLLQAKRAQLPDSVVDQIDLSLFRDWYI